MVTRSVTASGVIFVRSMFGACGSVPSFGPHRSLPPQFCATDVPARNNVNKKRPNCRPKGTRIRFTEMASGSDLCPLISYCRCHVKRKEGIKNHYENVITYHQFSLLVSYDFPRTGF